MKRVVAALIFVTASGLHVAAQPRTSTLDNAIDTFRAGDCTDARARIDAIVENDQRTRLWHAGIAQRCGDRTRAEQVIQALLRDVPNVQVDLAEWWPSLAELVDETRARIAATPRASAPIPSSTPTSPTSAPSPSFDIELGLVTGGHDARFADVAKSWHGSGLEAQFAVRGDRAVVELAGRALAYTDIGFDPLAGGGWELALDVRAGVRTALGRRIRLAALVVASGATQHVDAASMPMASWRYLGVGGAARAEVAATRSIAAGAEIGYLPLGYIATTVDNKSPTQVATRFAVAWRAAPRWRLEASVVFAGLRFAATTPTGEMAEHTDDAMRVTLGLGYAR